MGKANQSPLLFPTKCPRKLRAQFRRPRKMLFYSLLTIFCDMRKVKLFRFQLLVHLQPFPT